LRGSVSQSHDACPALLAGGRARVSRAHRLADGRAEGHATRMTSRFWMALLAGLLIAALTYVITRRVFGVAFLFLPLFFMWGGRSRRR
jgi:hypothetical protein